MDQKLKDFINTYTGISTGNTPENMGQCVGLVSVWMDTLGIAHEWGDAKDLLAKADTSKFDVIYNTPANFPVEGDIFVCGASWGAGYGHTGVIVSADVNSWTAFEQNNPEGHAPQILTHNNYNGMLGWLHPKVDINSEIITQPIAKLSSDDIVSVYKAICSRTPSDDEVKVRQDQQVNLYDLIKDVLDNDGSSVYVGLMAQSKDLQRQVNNEMEKVRLLTLSNDTLTKKLTACEGSKTATNTQTEIIPTIQFPLFLRNIFSYIFKR